MLGVDYNNTSVVYQFPQSNTIANHAFVVQTSAFFAQARIQMFELEPRYQNYSNQTISLKFLDPRLRGEGVGARGRRGGARGRHGEARERHWW